MMFVIIRISNEILILYLSIASVFRIFELNGLLDAKAFGALTSAINKSFIVSLDNYNSALKSITTTLSSECDIVALTNNQVSFC